MMWFLYGNSFGCTIEFPFTSLGAIHNFVVFSGKGYQEAGSPDSITFAEGGKFLSRWVCSIWEFVEGFGPKFLILQGAMPFSGIWWTCLLLWPGEAWRGIIRLHDGYNSRVVTEEKGMFDAGVCSQECDVCPYDVGVCLKLSYASSTCIWLCSMLMHSVNLSLLQPVRAYESLRAHLWRVWVIDIWKDTVFDILKLSCIEEAVVTNRGGLPQRTHRTRICKINISLFDWKKYSECPR